jgi:hypothetical protein
MRNILTRPIMAAVAAMALGHAGTDPAAAADIRPPQAQFQPAPPDYYPPPPVEQGYAYPPPAAYGYPPPPPAYYEYQAPPVVAIPRPYYWRPHYRPAYGERPYGVPGYGAYVAHGYGRYDRPWGRGYRGW